MADVMSLAQRLEAAAPGLSEAHPVLVACRERYSLLVACFAAWLRGGRVVLGPNLQPASLGQVRVESGALATLTDSNELAPNAVPQLTVPQHAVPQLIVPQRADSTAAELSESGVASVAGERQLLSIYTSGTTGLHQRCDKTARQLFGEAHTLVRVLGFSPETTLGSTVPSHHLYGLLFAALVPWFAGGRLVSPALFQPEDVMRAIAHWKISELVTVPTHLGALAAAWEPGRARLRRAFSSGAVLAPELARRFAERSGADVIDVLGSTESGGIGWRIANRERLYTPLPGVEVRADEEQHLLLRSPFLERTQAWQRMGDRVAVGSAGFEYLGRDDGVVKLGAKRVAVQQIEARTRELPGVSEVALLVRDSDTLRGKELWMAVVATEDWTPEQLRKRLAPHFDPVLLPRRIRRVASLPRTALGKISQRELLALFAADEAELSRERVEFTPPRINDASEHRELTCELRIPSDWVFTRGHFPEQPVVPGALQLSHIVLPSIARAWPELGRLRCASRIKFRRALGPGASLRLRVRWPRGGQNLSFELLERDQVATSGRLSFEPKAPPSALTSAPEEEG